MKSRKRRALPQLPMSSTLVSHREEWGEIFHEATRHRSLEAKLARFSSSL